MHGGVKWITDSQNSVTILIDLLTTVHHYLVEKRRSTKTVIDMLKITQGFYMYNMHIHTHIAEASSTKVNHQFHVTDIKKSISFTAPSTLWL